MSVPKNPTRPWWRLICPAASARAAARTMPRCPSRRAFCSASCASPRGRMGRMKRGQARPRGGVKNGSWAKLSSKILELNYDWTMEKRGGHHETWGVSHEFHEKWTMKNRGFDHVWSTTQRSWSNCWWDHWRTSSPFVFWLRGQLAMENQEMPEPSTNDTRCPKKNDESCSRMFVRWCFPHHFLVSNCSIYLRGVLYIWL